MLFVSSNHEDQLVGSVANKRHKKCHLLATYIREDQLVGSQANEQHNLLVSSNHEYDLVRSLGNKQYNTLLISYTQRLACRFSG